MCVTALIGQGLVNHARRVRWNIFLIKKEKKKDLTFACIGLTLYVHILAATNVYFDILILIGTIIGQLGKAALRVRTGYSGLKAVLSYILRCVFLDSCQSKSTHYTM